MSALLLAAGLAQAQVGMTELQVAGQPLTLVYPTAAPAQREMRGDFELHVAKDAEPLGTGRRLVVFSHGTGGSGLADHDLAATFARAGFVVAQVRHVGDNHLDTSRAGPESWRLRPKEVIAAIDALAAHSTWSKHVSFDKVGVHGMSAGGGTALTLAGGQWRTYNLIRHCLAHMDEDLGFCLNGLPGAEAQAKRRAQIEGARDVPENFMPAAVTQRQGTVDPRIASVTVAVPVSAIFDPAGLAAIRVPVGVVNAPLDTMLLPKYHAEHVLRHCSRCTRLADLSGGGHVDVLSPWPESVAKQMAAQQARGGWPEPQFDPAQRRAAFERIVAFHREHLGP